MRPEGTNEEEKESVREVTEEDVEGGEEKEEVGDKEEDEGESNDRPQTTEAEEEGEGGREGEEKEGEREDGDEKQGVVRGWGKWEVAREASTLQEGDLLGTEFEVHEVPSTDDSASKADAFDWGSWSNFATGSSVTGKGKDSGEEEETPPDGMDEEELESWRRFHKSAGGKKFSTPSTSAWEDWDRLDGLGKWRSESSAPPPLPEKIPSEEELVEEAKKLLEEEGPEVFRLYAVLVHSGSASSGHYYAHILDTRDGKWYEFNDSMVREEDAKDVARAYGGSSGSANAYMLIYR